MAATGECRGARGHRPGKLSSWARISGEAFSSAQVCPSAETATHSCERGCARSVPSRTPLQLVQPQFHWGKPPPAADPRTRTRTEVGPDYASGGGGLGDDRLVVAAVLVTLVG